MKYKLWAEMPDEQKRAFINEYIEQNPFMGSVDDIVKSSTVLGILKTATFEVRELDRSSQKRIITQDVPIGVIGVMPVQENNSLHIIFHYITDEYKGSFRGFYEYLLEKIKEWQYGNLYFWCDARTSRFLVKNAKTKAKRFLHIGKPEEFELQEEEEETSEANGSEHPDEKEPEEALEEENREVAT